MHSSATTKRAFVSYRHESEAHRKEVLAFCHRLAAALGDGSVELVNDQTLLEVQPAGPDEGWNRWSMNMAAHADNVIAIASPGWFAALDQKELEPPPGGIGSAVEATVIFNRHTHGRTISPWLRLVRLPTYPKSETNWLFRDIPIFGGTNEADIQALSRWIKGVDRTAAPPSATAPSRRPDPPSASARRVGPMITAAAGAAALLAGGFFLANRFIGGSKTAASPKPGTLASPVTESPTEKLSEFKPAALALPESPAAGTLGEVPLDATTTMQFRWCPPGAFTMGRTPPELPFVASLTESSDEWERQRLPVTLTEGFWMGETELTRKQRSSIQGTASTSANQGDDLPVAGVPYSEAVEIALDLTKKLASSGWRAHLPDEAEWEYACRAGTSGMFSFGEDIDPTQANYDPSYKLDRSSGIKGLGEAVAVRKFRANPWGLFDMHGNVSEWCAFGEHPSRSLSTPMDNDVFPVRGGSFASLWIKCTSGARSLIKATPGNNKTGLRLMLTKSKSPPP